MAADNFHIFNVAKPRIVNGVTKLYSDSFKIALVNSGAALANTFVGASNSARYADVSAWEISGTGYTAGGASTTVGVTGNATVTVTCTGASWSNATISACYAVVYDDTAANKELLGYVALDPAGGTANVSSTNGTFSATFPSGLDTIA